MINIKFYRDYRDIKEKFSKTTVAIGNFDGLHLGHKELLSHAKGLSIKSKSSLLVFTFYPHPLKLIRPGSEPKKILRLRTKLKKMSHIGVDIVLAQRFDNSFSKISAEDFVFKILLKHLNAVNIIVGKDFCFGYQRKGNVAYLGSGILDNKAELEVISTVKGSKGKYSSTTVRKLIQKGDMEEVKSMLGSYYEVEGKVFKGQQLGRKLGFPTANINYLDCITPKDGIYAGFIVFDGKCFEAALSSGVRPQFNGKKRFLEAHIMNFNKNIYGRRVRVLFVNKIRDEAVFEDVSKLKKQMLSDCREAIRLLKNIKI